MKRSVYSLVLADDVIQAVDRLAYANNTSRSNMVNRILAESLSIKTPEQSISDIFNEIETLLGLQGSFKPQKPASATVFNVRTALTYKYNPTIHYSIELYRNHPRFLGRLRISVRTQNEAFIGLMRRFFVLWRNWEDEALADFYPHGAPWQMENLRYTRDLRLPDRNCSSSQLGESIADYLQGIDRAIKLYFKLSIDDARETYDKLYDEFEKMLGTQEIIL